MSDSLLAHKAFVNARNVSGLTALHLASVEGYNDLVQDLIVNHTAQKDCLSLVRDARLDGSITSRVERLPLAGK